MHAATPLALSLRLTRCERTSQSNGKQTIQSTTRSHLAKSSYRSFVFEIHSTYVEVPNHIVSSIVRFVPPQESTHREAAAFVHQGDRGLHGEPSGRFGPEDKNSSSNLRHRKRRSGDKKAGGETHRKRTKQGRRVDTPRRPDDSSATGNELNRADEWTHPRRPDDSSPTNSRRRRS